MAECQALNGKAGATGPAKQAGQLARQTSQRAGTLTARARQSLVPATRPTAGRWSKGMTVCNFEKMGGMHHFGGTASQQVDFRHTVAMKLDHQKFCDLIVDALERLSGRKA